MQGSSLRLSPDEHTGRTLGKYEVLCRLSLGGMSEIFLAFSRGLAGFRKLVVLKQILPDIKGEEEFVRMFLDEAKITAAFNHPNIAQVFDLDVQDGELFLAMEFVPGGTLVEVARACRAGGEPIPMGFTLQAVRDTALALHYAHTFTDPLGRLKTVIHRDIAEKNIMVTYEGTTKLLDFGIAKNFGRAGRTQVGMVKGTSGYMSPEQIMGEPLDPRSDVFSLGVVLHECLTGMRLFHGKTPEQGMLAALKGEVAPPSAQNRAVTAALDQVCARALARKRDDRFSNALEFARELERAAGSLTWHPEQSGAFMQRIFQDRREETRKLVASIQDEEVTGATRIVELLGESRPRPSITRPPPIPNLPRIVEPPPPPVPVLEGDDGEFLEPEAMDDLDREHTEPRGMVTVAPPLTQLPKPKPGAPRPLPPPVAEDTSEVTGPKTSAERPRALTPERFSSVDIPLVDPPVGSAALRDDEDGLTMPASDLEALLGGAGFAELLAPAKPGQEGSADASESDETTHSGRHLPPDARSATLDTEGDAESEVDLHDRDADADADGPEGSYTANDTEPGSENPLRRRGRARKRWVAAALLLVAVGALGYGYLHLRGDGVAVAEGPPPPTPVLPPASLAPNAPGPDSRGAPLPSAPGAPPPVAPPEPQAPEAPSAAPAAPGEATARAEAARPPAGSERPPPTPAPSPSPSAAATAAAPGRGEGGHEPSAARAAQSGGTGETKPKKPALRPQSRPAEPGAVTTAAAASAASPAPTAGTEGAGKSRSSAANNAWEKAGPNEPAKPPGRLTLVTYPQATVMLKSQRLGVTPLTEVSLPVGTHTLRIIEDGGKVRLLQVDISAGEPTTVDVPLDALLEEHP